MRTRTTSYLELSPDAAAAAAVSAAATEDLGVEVVEEGAEGAPAVPTDAPEKLSAAEVEEPTREELEALADMIGIDDPVRMYLTQMGEIPLLTATRRSPWPRRSRSPAAAVPPESAVDSSATATLLDDAQDAVQQRATAAVRPHGQGPQTENLEKDKILARMPHNLGPRRRHGGARRRHRRTCSTETDEALRPGDAEGSASALPDAPPPQGRHLVEELSIRTQKVQP